MTERHSVSEAMLYYGLEKSRERTKMNINVMTCCFDCKNVKLVLLDNTQ